MLQRILGVFRRSPCGVRSEFGSEEFGHTRLRMYMDMFYGYSVTLSRRTLDAPGCQNGRFNPSFLLTAAAPRGGCRGKQDGRMGAIDTASFGNWYE